MIDLVDDPDTFQLQGFKETEAKLIAAELLIALEELHLNNIIYRDFKPKNILITKDGHICFADFGLSTTLKDFEKYKSKHRTGTPGYMAPEMACGLSYSFGIDIFAYGCTVYELLHGLPPLNPYNFQKLSKSKAFNLSLWEYKISPLISSDAQDFLHSLLRFDPKDRLGCDTNKGKAGIQYVMQHKWFNDINWSKIRQRKLPIPVLQEAAYDFIKLQKRSPYNNKKVSIASRINDKYQEHFKHFEWNYENPSRDSVILKDLLIAHSTDIISNSSGSPRNMYKQRVRSNTSSAGLLLTSNHHKTLKKKAYVIRPKYKEISYIGQPHTESLRYSNYDLNSISRSYSRPNLFNSLKVSNYSYNSKNNSRASSRASSRTSHRRTLSYEISTDTFLKSPIITNTRRLTAVKSSSSSSNTNEHIDQQDKLLLSNKIINQILEEDENHNENVLMTISKSKSIKHDHDEQLEQLANTMDNNQALEAEKEHKTRSSKIIENLTIIKSNQIKEIENKKDQILPVKEEIEEIEEIEQQQQQQQDEVEEVNYLNVPNE